MKLNANQGELNQHVGKRKEPTGSSDSALQKVALLAQLTSELENDPEFVRKLTELAGEEAAAAASSLSKLLGGKSLISPSESIPSAAHESVALPSLPDYLDKFPDSLPALPPILSPSLATIPFIHRAVANPGGKASANGDYERLEFLGDAYIEIIATRLIYHRYPSITSGKLASLREDLVKNESLAEYALAYGLDERAKIPKDFLSVGVENRKLWVKLLGDIFEAYVAAVVVSDPSNGFGMVENWLSCLWRRKLPMEDTEAPLNTNAKTQLAQKILGKPPIKVEYRLESQPKEIPGRVVYEMGVYLTGWGWQNQRLGIGSGLSKNEAGTRAAMAALENPLAAQIGAVKREFDDQIKAERSKEGGGDPAVMEALEKKYKGIQ